MSFKVATILILAAVSVSPVVAEEAASAAEGAEAAAEAPKENPELEAEINYVEALVNYGYPDIAAPVIEETKKKWPESEVRFFAIEIRGLLALGKFDEAEKKIAALPDRKSSKYWAARLEVANNYYGRGQKEECMKIYGEFFTAYPKPPADLRKFYMEACYAYGQLLAGDRQYALAAERYEALLKQLANGSDEWCNLACETVEIYLRLADESKDPKDKAKRDANLKAAGKIADKLLWQHEKPLYFGRAVSMKAHIEQMKGDIDRAEALVDEHLPQLRELHDQIVQYDPEGKMGLLKQSPLPECLYLQAKMLWDEIQAESKKTPKRDDEKIKAWMFGPRPKNGGKRDGSKGAFNMALNVFLNYETSAWAPAAGDVADGIKAMAEKLYKANIKTVITDEQRRKVRAAQFKDANEKFLAQQYREAIDAYLAVLAKYPEVEESVMAVENIASCYLDLTIEEQDEAKKQEYRDNCDAVEGYLAERFSGSKSRVMMTAGGDATIRLAAKETQYKNPARADWLYTEFFTNYRQHTTAATLAAAKANEAQEAKRYDDAIKYWSIIAEYYTNSTYYAASLAQLSRCYGKLGDKKNEIAYINRYLPVETGKIRKLQAQFQLAQMYQKDGLSILADAATNVVADATNAVEVAAAVERDERRGTAQIIRAVKNFTGFVGEADKALNDPSTMLEDKASYIELKEAALFMLGECWSRMNRPEKNLQMYRERAAKSYEDYVQAFPEGKYVKIGLVKLGTIYTALGDMAKSKDALDRLSEKYPDSDEAKNAKPRLAKNLIEMGMKKEGAEIYAEMLHTDGSYTAWQFVNAGEALIEGKSWDLANQAFEKAIRLAGTNQVTVAAKARLGQARSLWKQKSYAEAREALDLFLSDPKMAKMAIAADANFMLVEVASDQGRGEKDSTMRTKHFNAAIGALKKVRQYWSKKPMWEQDQLDLLSGDILVDRMKAEEAMGLKDEAMETCGLAAGKFQTFTQSRGANEDHPIDKMEAGAVANLERAYASLIPLLVKQGAANADLVIKYGQQYLDLFPNGKSRTLIENGMNQARADLPAGAGEVKSVKNDAPAEKADAPAEKADASAEKADAPAED